MLTVLKKTNRTLWKKAIKSSQTNIWEGQPTMSQPSKNSNSDIVNIPPGTDTDGTAIRYVKKADADSFAGISRQVHIF